MKLGAFEVGEKIGQGGMSEVFQGHHENTGLPVAIKITRFASTDDVLRRAFAGEVAAMARVHHPGVVGIHDWGGLADGTGNWCAIEWASNGCLNPSTITRWSQLRDVLRAVLEALAHAHARNIIHRDLKPGNVLDFGEGHGWRYRLADFTYCSGIGPLGPATTPRRFETCSNYPTYSTRRMRFRSSSTMRRRSISTQRN